jgi:hypothetical protein
LAVLALCGSTSARAQLTSVIFSENFDGLSGSLEPSVNERRSTVATPVTRVASDPSSEPIPNAFTKVGPTGWEIDNTLAAFNSAATVGNTGVPGAGVVDYGVDEWEGWSFANREFWVAAAGDQQRSQFTNSSGNIAVADSDEYFDLGDPNHPTNGGFYNTALRTPSIPVTGGQLYSLSFDSSWRDEAFDDAHPNAAFNNLNNQAVEVLALFNEGTTQQRAFWNSDPGSGSFKNDTTNEHIMVGVGVPAGATSVRFQFNYANAGNDWWWAVDNLEVSNVSLGGTSVWSEDFDGLAPGPSVNERQAFAVVTRIESDANSMPIPNAYTHTPPAGWDIDSSGVPGEGRDDVGVYEWEGWSFTTPEFWTTADLQLRETFTKASGVLAVADPDEWDDLGSPANLGFFDSILETPQLNIAGQAANSLALSFDSAWRDEGAQTALVTVDYGNGPIEVLRWESNPASQFFHDDNTNETVLVPIHNPPGAATAQLTFQMLQAGNNWFWAIDNVQIGTIDSADVPGDYNADGRVNAADYVVWRNQEGTNFALPNRNPALNGPIGQGDYNFWVANFGSPGGSGSGLSVPEPGAWLLILAGISGWGCRDTRPWRRRD